MKVAILSAAGWMVGASGLMGEPLELIQNAQARGVVSLSEPWQTINSR